MWTQRASAFARQLTPGLMAATFSRATPAQCSIVGQGTVDPRQHQFPARTGEKATTGPAGERFDDGEFEGLTCSTSLIKPLPAPANRITPTHVAETGKAVQSVRIKVTSMSTRYATTRLSWTRICCSFTQAERISRKVCAARSSPTLIAASKLASDSAVISVTRAAVSIAVSSSTTWLTLPAREGPVPRAERRIPGTPHLLLALMSECRRGTR